MAELTIQIGPVTATCTFDDAKAQRHVKRVLRAAGQWVEGESNQARLNRYHALLLRFSDEMAQALLP